MSDINPDNDFLCSDELIDYARKLLFQGWSTFQICKRIKTKLPSCNFRIVRKIVKKAIALQVSELDTSYQRFKADTIYGINYIMQRDRPKEILKALALRVKMLDQMNDDVKEESLEERAALIRDFLTAARFATDGSLHKKEQGQKENPKPEPEETPDDKPKEDNEITPDEENEIKLAQAHALKEQIKKQEREIKQDANQASKVVPDKEEKS